VTAELAGSVHVVILPTAEVPVLRGPVAAAAVLAWVLKASLLSRGLRLVPTVCRGVVSVTPRIAAAARPT
jgi:hypothetical protein